MHLNGACSYSNSLIFQTQDRRAKSWHVWFKTETECDVFAMQIAGIVVRRPGRCQVASGRRAIDSDVAGGARACSSGEEKRRGCTLFVSASLEWLKMSKCLSVCVSRAGSFAFSQSSPLPKTHEIRDRSQVSRMLPLFCRFPGDRLAIAACFLVVSLLLMFSRERPLCLLLCLLLAAASCLTWKLCGHSIT